MSVKIEYGIHKETGKIKHISEVERGEKSGCYCIECGEKLIVRKGKIQRPHFQHKTSTKCSGGNAETILHKIGKEILKNNNKILLSNERYFNYSEVEIEKKINDYKPDAIIKNENNNWLIEIAVTHFLDNDKIRKIQRDNRNCLEITLDKDLIYKEPEFIKKEVLNNPNNRKIIHDTELKKVKENSIKPRKEINWVPLAIVTIALIFRKPIRKFIKNIIG